jgi:hypothetical protein
MRKLLTMIRYVTEPFIQCATCLDLAVIVRKPGLFVRSCRMVGKAPQLSVLSQSHVECFRLDLWRCPCHGWGGCLPAFYNGGLVPISGQSELNLWWLKWYWDKFFSQYWHCYLSGLFHQWSIFIYSSIASSRNSWQCCEIIHYVMDPTQ